MNPHYKDYSEYLAEYFPGIKVQKISVNAGFSCPNRDGTIGHGGCIYCDNSTFTPAYCFGIKSVSGQIRSGKEFFRRKYPEMKYLAYFQSFTNTFGDDTSRLESLYTEALSQEDVVGLIVGTRPDCMPDNVVELLSRLNDQRKVFVELGAESSHDETLKLINRGHSWRSTQDAVRRLADAGLSVGLHLICGLPGETEEMVLESVQRCLELPIDSLKFHHLQVIKGTELERRWRSGELKLTPFTQDRYIELCIKLVRMVGRRVAIERFLASSPPEKVVAPKWGIKNYEFVNILKNRLNTI